MQSHGKAEMWTILIRKLVPQMKPNLIDHPAEVIQASYFCTRANKA